MKPWLAFKLIKWKLVDSSNDFCAVSFKSETYDVIFGGFVQGPDVNPLWPISSLFSYSYCGFRFQHLLLLDKYGAAIFWMLLYLILNFSGMKRFELIFCCFKIIFALKSQVWTQLLRISSIWSNIFVFYWL